MLQRPPGPAADAGPALAHRRAGEWKGGKTKLSTCDISGKKRVGDRGSHQAVAEDEEVVFTYDVTYKPSDIRWASRWDTYLLATDDQVGAGLGGWVNGWMGELWSRLAHHWRGLRHPAPPGRLPSLTSPVPPPDCRRCTGSPSSTPS